MRKTAETIILAGTALFLCLLLPLDGLRKTSVYPAGTQNTLYIGAWTDANSNTDIRFNVSGEGSNGVYRDAPGDFSGDLGQFQNADVDIPVPTEANIERQDQPEEDIARAQSACAKGEKNVEKIRDFLWRLAYLEQTIGYESMKKSYATVDVTEHAITTDSESWMAGAPKPLPTDPYPYDQIADNAGLFLPDGVSYNETVCAGPGMGEIDVRWYLHGYLSTAFGGVAKPIVGWVYNTGLGYGKTEEGRHNADTNSRSLKMGIEMKEKKKGLGQFAMDVLLSLNANPNPPSDTKYREWQKYKPLTPEEIKAEMNRVILEWTPTQEDAASYNQIVKQVSLIKVNRIHKGKFELQGKLSSKKAENFIFYRISRFADPKIIEPKFTR